MKKFYSILIALLALVGVAQAKTITWVASEQGYANAEDVTTIDFGSGVTATLDKGTNKNGPKYYSTGTALRLYGANTMTISGATIQKVVFTFASGYADGIVSDPEGYALDGTTGTWEGSASSVTFTREGSSGHVRIQKIELTIQIDDPNFVDNPVVTPATGTYYFAQTVSIACDTEGATIYYTTDGNSPIDLENAPAETSQVYSEPFVISETTNIKAAAYKNGSWSAVVEEMIEIQQATDEKIADIIAHGAADGISTTATVVAISNSGLLLQDETGAMYVYTETAPEVAVGDVVNVAGSVTMYPANAGDLARAQFSKPQITKTGSTTVEYPTPTVLDGAAFDALVLAPEVKYVKVAGTVAISTSGYYNLTIAGATKTGSIVATQEVLSQLENGMSATLTGYYVYSTGSVKDNVFTPNYGNIVVTDYELTAIEYNEYSTFEAAKADAVNAASATDAAAKFAKLNLTEALVTFVKGSGNNVNIYLSDGENGMLVFGANSKSLKAGQKVSGTIKGKLYRRYGNAQLANPVYDLTVVSSDNAVEPKAVAVDALVANHGADYENELVVLSNLLPLKSDDSVADDQITWKSQNLSFDGYDDDFENVIGTVVVRDNWSIAKSFVFNKNVPCQITGLVALYTKDDVTTVQVYPRTAADIEGGVDAINGITVDAPAAKAIYNIAGQRVQNLNKAGLYIVNGKKVVVK